MAADASLVGKWGASLAYSREYVTSATTVSTERNIKERLYSAVGSCASKRLDTAIIDGSINIDSSLFIKKDDAGRV